MGSKSSTERAETGDSWCRPEEIDRLVGDHADALFAFAVSRVGDEGVAEELVQETFLGALRDRESFRGKSAFRTWLIGIMRHKIADHWRRTAREERLHDGAAEDSAVQEMFTTMGQWRHPPSDGKLDPNDMIEREEFWAAFRECLSRLPAGQRSVFALRVMEEHGVDSICKALGASATNVWVMLHRARLRLRRCLEAEWLASQE